MENNHNSAIRDNRRNAETDKRLDNIDKNIEQLLKMVAELNEMKPKKKVA